MELVWLRSWNTCYTFPRVTCSHLCQESWIADTAAWALIVGALRFLQLHCFTHGIFPLKLHVNEFKTSNVNVVTRLCCSYDNFSWPWRYSVLILSLLGSGTSTPKSLFVCRSVCTHAAVILPSWKQRFQSGSPTLIGKKRGNRESSKRWTIRSLQLKVVAVGYVSAWWLNHPARDLEDAFRRFWRHQD